MTPKTRIGIIILATQELKDTCAFDGAVGTYEKAIRYLKPMNDLLTVPLALIGLKAPNSFVVKKMKKDGKNYGFIESR